MYQNMKNGKRINKHEKRMTYLICILAILILLIGAAFGPQLLFAVQDKRTQEKIVLGERNSMDMAALNESYTKVLRTRMMNFAEGMAEDKNYYANATEYAFGVDEESYNILENGVLESEWVAFLGDIGMIPYLYDVIYPGYYVEDWKRYVIYDDDFENGVAFMAWYFDINAGNGLRIKLLVDTEDYTLYSIQISETSIEYGFYDWVADYGYNWLNGDYETLTELLPLYWFYYYEAGVSEAESYDEYQESLRIYEKTTNYSMTESDASLDASMLMSEGNFLILEKWMPYGENQLKWKMKFAEKSSANEPFFTMGIEKIQELIPEFAE